MHVFLCWSGRRSHELATKLEGWLPRVLGKDAVTCFLSSSSIAKGSVWFQELSGELRRAKAALICLTPENLQSAWMHFEAGAVFAPERRDRIYTYFLGLDASRVRRPFNDFQVTLSTEDDTRALVGVLAGNARVPSQRWERAFRRKWTDLEGTIRQLEVPHIEDLIPDFRGLFQRKTFEEPLEECVDQNWLDRYHAARDTWQTLEQYRPAVADACKPFQVWLYAQLLAHLDGYVREIKNLLLGERFFAIERSKVDFTRPHSFRPQEFPAGVATVAERRCREIRHLAFWLSRPDGAPVLDDALDFAKLRLTGFDDRKKLVHWKGLRIDRRALGLRTEAELERCGRSFWEFDRAMYYLARETDPTSVALMTGAVAQELEKLQANPVDASAMPLHYAIRALLASLRRGMARGSDPDDVSGLLDQVQDYLRESGRDAGRQIQRKLGQVRSLLEPRAAREALRGVAAKIGNGQTKTRSGTPRRRGVRD